MSASENELRGRRIKDLEELEELKELEEIRRLSNEHAINEKTNTKHAFND